MPHIDTLLPHAEWLGEGWERTSSTTDPIPNPELSIATAGFSGPGGARAYVMLSGYATPELADASWPRNVDLMERILVKFFEVDYPSEDDPEPVPGCTRSRTAAGYGPIWGILYEEGYVLCALPNGIVASIRTSGKVMGETGSEAAVRFAIRVAAGATTYG